MTQQKIINALLSHECAFFFGDSLFQLFSDNFEKNLSDGTSYLQEPYFVWNRDTPQTHGVSEHVHKFLKEIFRNNLANSECQRSRKPLEAFHFFVPVLFPSLPNEIILLQFFAAFCMGPCDISCKIRQIFRMQQAEINIAQIKILLRMLENDCFHKCDYTTFNDLRFAAHHPAPPYSALLCHI